MDTPTAIESLLVTSSPCEVELDAVYRCGDCEKIFCTMCQLYKHFICHNSGGSFHFDNFHKVGFAKNNTACVSTQTAENILAEGTHLKNIMYPKILRESQYLAQHLFMINGKERNNTELKEAEVNADSYQVLKEGQREYPERKKKVTKRKPNPKDAVEALKYKGKMPCEPLLMKKYHQYSRISCGSRGDHLYTEVSVEDKDFHSNSAISEDSDINHDITSESLPRNPKTTKCKYSHALKKFKGRGETEHECQNSDGNSQGNMKTAKQSTNETTAIIEEERSGLLLEENFQSTSSDDVIEALKSRDAVETSVNKTSELINENFIGFKKICYEVKFDKALNAYNPGSGGHASIKALGTWSPTVITEMERLGENQNDSGSLQNLTRTNGGIGNSNVGNQTKKPSEKVTCTICGKSVLKISYTSHKNLHLGIAPFLCDICGRKYSGRGSLSSHKVYCHEAGSGMKQCKVCEKKFAANHLLNDHMLHHTKEKEFTCEKCGRIFYAKSNLRKHMRKVHSPNLQCYQCSLCDKQFKYYTGLKDHLQTHEKTFDCEVCGKLLSSNCSKQRHMKIHTGTKAHKCHICGNAFIQKSAYWVHMEKHHDLTKAHLKQLMPEEHGGRPFAQSAARKEENGENVDSHEEVFEATDTSFSAYDAR